MKRHFLVAAASVVASAGSLVVGQGPAGSQTPTFEVASVKQNKSGDGRVMMGFQPGGRYTATNVTMNLVLRQAYQMQPSQIIGAPSWFDSDHFDIVAKAEGSVPLGPPPSGGPGPLQYMMRALLADRFKLAVHNETRDLQGYALVLARSDRKLGPKLQPISAECQEIIASRGRGPAGGPGGGAGVVGRGGPPGPPPIPQPGEKMPCGSTRFGPASLTSGGLTMAQLAQNLSQPVNRIVQDKTGLTGVYEFDLQWTPDQLPGGRGGDLPPGFPTIDPNGPSIFTAVQEQLGLKLDSQKLPVEVLVIDHAEHPTDD
jgi:uncharacterized protein (TIGR03435 family)